MTRLLSCPFCGGASQLANGTASPAVWEHTHFSRVFCGQCQTRQLFHRTDEEAIAAWNTRALTEREAFTFDDAWQSLLDKDDRTSPEDYPEMCLITYEELRDYMQRGTLYVACTPRHPIEKLESAQPTTAISSKDGTGGAA